MGYLAPGKAGVQSKIIKPEDRELQDVCTFLTWALHNMATCGQLACWHVAKTLIAKTWSLGAVARGFSYMPCPTVQTVA